MKDIVKSQINDEYKVQNGRKVRVNRRRRRSNLMTYCAIAVAVFTAIGLVVCLNFLFNLKEVRVEGVSLYTNDQILLVGGVEKGANLIRTNTSIIEQRLVETLPYIEKATVSKDYPNSLNIKIVEARKSADIEQNGAYYVISTAGMILEAGNQFHDPELPLIKGYTIKEPEINKELTSEDSVKTKVLLQLLKEIREARFSGITVIDLTERNDIVMMYKDRIELRVGSSFDIPHKLRDLKAVIDTRLEADFEGTLIYNGVNSGISAITKAAREAAAAEAAKRNAGKSDYRSTLTHDFGDLPREPEVPAEQQQTPAGEQEYTGWQ